MIPSVRTVEGGGFVVRRPFPVGRLEQLDPFLLLDEMGPIETTPGRAVGAPDHPHRGFETVTYLLEGEAEHEDSAGHRGKLGPGDVQWMTAGRGIVHSEMPSRRLQREGGRMHGFQLWVNLPKRDKRIAPRYQEISSAIAGQPLREPMARYGPFVMNTREELIEAFEDYEAGRMGRIERDARE